MVCYKEYNFDEAADSNGNCGCQDGFELENSVCIPKKVDCNPAIEGCSKSYKYGETQVCASCNIEKGFISDNGECKCYKGYIVSEGACKIEKENNCNASITIPGCLQCDANDINKCILCDGYKNYLIDDIDDDFFIYFF